MTTTYVGRSALSVQELPSSSGGSHSSGIWEEIKTLKTRAEGEGSLLPEVSSIHKIIEAFS